MKKLILPLLIASAFLSSCTKRGPQGPQGPAGQNGLDGLNANVQAFVYEVQPSAWIQSGNPGDIDFGFYAPASFPELTDDILVNGTVAGFYLLGSDEFSGQIPMPAIFYNDGYQSNYDFVLYPEEIEFWIRESDNQTLAPASTKYYKMIVVSGKYKNMPDMENATLEELEAHFGITEYKKVSVK